MRDPQFKKGDVVVTDVARDMGITFHVVGCRIDMGRWWYYLEEVYMPPGMERKYRREDRLCKVAGA